MSSETNFQQVLPAWLDLASKTDVSLGLDPSDAFQRAEKLLNDLRSGQASTEGWAPEADQVEVLYALVASVCRQQTADPESALRDVELVYAHLSSLPWRLEEFGGQKELLSACALNAWSSARRFATWLVIQKCVNRITKCEQRFRGDRSTTVPTSDAGARELVDGPSLLLYTCELLRLRSDTSPADVLRDGARLYALGADRSEGFDPDEHEQLLGELALIGGAACRYMLRVGEASTWFRSAQRHFDSLKRPEFHRARLAYQEVALMAEERRYKEVLDAVGPLTEAFHHLGMPEEALKCGFLEGATRFELGEPRNVVRINEGICRGAEALGNSRLLGQATSNLALCYGDLGEGNLALSYARKAHSILKQVGDEVHIVRLLWGLGKLFRGQGKASFAMEAFQESKAEATHLGLRGDTVAASLVIADLFLEAGQEDEAASEIRAALPIIEEEKMVPEGIAALSLLRESLRRRQIDHGALRDLHRHLEDRHH